MFYDILERHIFVSQIPFYYVHFFLFMKPQRCRRVKFTVSGTHFTTKKYNKNINVIQRDNLG